MVPLLLLQLLASPIAQGAEAVVELPPGMSWSDVRHPGIGFAEGGRGRQRHLYVDPSAAIWLTRLGVDVSFVSPPSTAEGYRSAAEMVSAVDELATRSDGLAGRVDLGVSTEGRPIVGLRIRDTETPVGRVRILGAHHGDEPISATVALATADALVTRFLGDDESIVDALGEVEVWVVPHVNPDGIEALTRHNARDVDLNRNYGHLWRSDEYHPGERAFSEPETRAVQALAVRAPAVLGLSLHSGAANIGWVWNYTTTPAPDALILSQLAEDYARLCAVPEFWTTNGAAWYPTNGDTNDWSYAGWGTLDFTLELSETKAPSPADIDEVVSAHLDAILDFVQSSQLSSGQVVDALTGRPIGATLLDRSSGSLVRASTDGRYARVAQPGVLEVSAPGHSPLELPASGHHAEVPLQPELPTEPRTVHPPVARAGDELRLDTAGLGDAVWVHAPGTAGVPLATESVLSLVAAPPGLWVVEGSDALGLLRVDGESAARVLHIDRGPDGWQVELDQGGHGRELWVMLDGQLQHRREADTVHTRLFLEAAELPADHEGTVDIAIWGPGGPTWVHDLHGRMWTSETPFPGTDGLDTGLFEPRPDGRVTNCSCRADPSGSHPLLLALAPVLYWRRRP